MFAGVKGKWKYPRYSRARLRRERGKDRLEKSPSSRGRAADARASTAEWLVVWLLYSCKQNSDKHSLRGSARCRVYITSLPATVCVHTNG